MNDYRTSYPPGTEPSEPFEQAYPTAGHPSTLLELLQHTSTIYSVHPAAGKETVGGGVQGTRKTEPSSTGPGLLRTSMPIWSADSDMTSPVPMSDSSVRSAHETYVAEMAVANVYMLILTGP